MSVIIGIDVGGSTTKIVGFEKENGKLIDPMVVRATDPLTSIYGAFGKFTEVNKFSLNDIEKVMITGVGSASLSDSIYGLRCDRVPEFPSVGTGGVYLSGVQSGIIVSMGTGTALIHASKDGSLEYLGGTGVGGGTLKGLSKKLLDVERVESIVALAEKGDLDNVDLRIKDMTEKNILPTMPRDMTASNFGKVSDLATKEDVAYGIINMVFETVAMLAIFAARQYGEKDIVLTGSLTKISLAKTIFDTLSGMFGVNFIIPDKAQFGTVIGAALLGLRGEA